MLCVFGYISNSLCKDRYAYNRAGSGSPMMGSWVQSSRWRISNPVLEMMLDPFTTERNMVLEELAACVTNDYTVHLLLDGSGVSAT